MHAGHLLLQTHTHNMQHIAFPQQQSLHERTSMLHFTHISRLVSYDASSVTFVYAAVLQCRPKTPILIIQYRRQSVHNDPYLSAGAVLRVSQDSYEEAVFATRECGS